MLRNLMGKLQAMFSLTILIGLFTYFVIVMPGFWQSKAGICFAAVWGLMAVGAMYANYDYLAAQQRIARRRRLLNEWQRSSQVKQPGARGNTRAKLTSVN